MATLIDPVNQTTTPTLHTTIQNYADTKLLKTMEEKLVYHANAVKRVLPKNHGKKMEFWKYVKLNAVTDPLTEGTVPAAQTISQAKIEASIDQYGAYIATTDMLALTMVDYETARLTTLISDQGALSIDTLVRDTMLTTTNVLYSNGKTGRAELDSGDPLTVDDIRRAVRILEKKGAPKFYRNGKGFYKCIIGADAKFALQSDTKWIDVATYQQAEKIENGEIGKLYGVIFIETTNNKQYPTEGAGSAPVDASFVFGDEAYAVIGLGEAGDNAHVVVKPHGSAGTADPLNQVATIGWKVDGMAAVILNNDWLIRVESGVAE